MPPYRSPEYGSGSYGSKFIRVGDTIVVTEPNDLDTPHDNLAIAEGIYNEVKRLKIEKPDDVDAGLLNYSKTKAEIALKNDSSRLELPKTYQARKKSVEIFQNQSHGFNVVAPEKHSIFK